MNLNRSKIAAVGSALLVSYGITVALLLALAFLLYKMKLQPTQVGVGVVAIYILASMAGGFLTVKALKRRRLLCGIWRAVSGSASGTVGGFPDGFFRTVIRRDKSGGMLPDRRRAGGHTWIEH